MKKLSFILSLSVAPFLFGEQQNYFYPNHSNYYYLESFPHHDHTIGMSDKVVQEPAKKISDEDLAKSIRDTLHAMFIEPSVTFEVDQGNVTLKGTVESQETSNKIEESVKRIEGVGKIDNQIKVKESKISYSYYDPSRIADNTAQGKMVEDFAATDGDKQVNSKIRDKLGKIKGYETIILSTNNGIVTITGILESKEDITKANDEIKKVNGVKKIHNQLKSNKK